MTGNKHALPGSTGLGISLTHKLESPITQFYLDLFDKNLLFESGLS